MKRDGHSGYATSGDLAKGWVYRGDVLHGRPHGERTLTWPSGAAYTGQWANGSRQGTGTYRDREGGTYVDEYRDGMRAGQGQFTWPNGRVAGHAVVGDVTRTANVLHIDTGSGFRDGRLTLARIDVDLIETVTMGTVCR